jgi:hypothetical protein
MTTELVDCAPSVLPKLQKTHEGEHHGDYGENIPITRSAYIFAMCAAVNSFNLGYDIGTSTSAGPLVQDDMGLTITEREIFVGSLNFWASKFTECFFFSSSSLRLFSLTPTLNSGSISSFRGAFCSVFYRPLRKTKDIYSRRHRVHSGLPYYGDCA